MKIVSLKSNKNRLSLNELLGVQGALRSVTAISAYIDIESIKQLFKFVNGKADSRGRPTLKVFIDSSSSRFYSDRVVQKDLISLQESIEDSCAEGSGIYLVKYGKLFHSKIYLVESNKKGRLIIGSMNLTQKGIYENEEVILIGDYSLNSREICSSLSNSVKEYSCNLEENAILVKKGAKGRYPSCMRQFLLDGMIYYEVKEQSPFRFKLCLPETILKQQADIDPLLESNVTDTVSVERLIPGGAFFEESDLTSQDKSRVSWKRFCVETCYGFWSPSLLQKEIASALNKRKEGRQPYYDNICLTLKDRKDEIRESFVDLCIRIQRYLCGIGVMDWKYGKRDDAIAAWDKWFDSLVVKLENEKFYERLVVGVASVPVPDVWSDPLSSEELESSFYESILYYWSKEYSKETINVVAKAIASNIDAGGRGEKNMDTDKLRKSMERWFLDEPNKNILESIK